MKYTFLLSICLAFGLAANGQTIPNGDFENWEIRDHFTPKRWYAYTQTVSKTTDCKVGNSALKLENKYSPTSNGSKGYATNYRSDDKENFGGFAFDGGALSMVFWCKHDLALGDTARVYAVFREEGVYRGQVDFRFTGKSDGEFVKYSAPITWNGARICDTVQLYLYSKVRSKIEGDGYVIIDDLHFENIGDRTSEIYNYDFEEWNNIGVHFPSEWESIDLRLYDNYSTFYSRRSVGPGGQDSAHTGDHGLVLKNYFSGSNLRAGYCYFGSENDDYYTPAFAFTDTFKYLQGYYKYYSENNDTALISARTYQSGSRRSLDNLYLPSSEDWTFFSMPINYSSAYTPDSASIIMYSAIGTEDLGDGTTLYIDNLAFVLTPTPLKLSVRELEESIQLYPNPCTNTLYTDTKNNYTHCDIVDVIGKTITLPVFQNKVDVSTLSAGTYVVIFRNEYAHTSKHKIFKTN